MRTETVGDPTDPNLLCVIGWGNRLQHENVRWLVETLAADSFVHAVEIPDVVTSFEREYLDPVRELAETLGTYRFIGHSTGGLIGAYLRDPAPEPTTRTYLSPWWGFAPETTGPLLSLVQRLPISRPIVPTGGTREEKRAAIGELATDRQLREGPDAAAPTFLREAGRAHVGLAAIDPDPTAVAFCTLTDPVVDPRRVGDRIAADRTILYDGGHELFSSRSRTEHRKTLRAAVREGPDALG
ncbi:alpha/beta fold hydrolase domain-containing protein [Halorubrum vacuolatum]|uniref:Alpha/beta hydrolase family protein n=1 Tax=Halorubrum vacuolatum TaxID=63740 RepID=A0A238VQ74_HALVU|nr:hypothetical protein [Halorubrum vacuolatum]SNR35933.1 hypothetical protein SAMN06264855_103196 [Halorubrum vacuolatum]